MEVRLQQSPPDHTLGEHWLGIVRSLSCPKCGKLYLQETNHALPDNPTCGACVESYQVEHQGVTVSYEKRYALKVDETLWRVGVEVEKVAP